MPLGTSWSIDQGVFCKLCSKAAADVSVPDIHARPRSQAGHADVSIHATKVMFKAARLCRYEHLNEQADAMLLCGEY